MRMALHTRMLIGGAAGAAGGVLAHLTLHDSPALDAFVRYGTQPIGQVFLRLLFMLVIPLIFSALVMGVAGLGDLRRLGRIGLKTLAYTVVVSSIAVVLGVVLVNTLRPGEGLPPAQRAELTASAADRASSLATATTAPRTGIQFLVHLVPDNPLRAAVEGDMLAVMFFSLLAGIGLTLTSTPAARRLLAIGFVGGR